MFLFEHKHRLFYLAGLIPGLLLVYFFTKSQMESRLPATSWASEAREDWPLLVLNNEAKFSEFRRATGFCTTLVELEDGDVVAVTAESLLDSIGGVSALDGALEEWKIYPHGSPSQSFEITGLHGAPAAYRNMAFDCVLLDVTEPVDGFPVTPLRVRSGMPPGSGATVYVVTRPRGWSEKPQVVHEARIVDTFMGVIRGRTVDNVKLDRFIGAPVLNPSGHLEGIIVAERQDSSGAPGGFYAHSLRVVLKKLD